MWRRKMFTGARFQLHIPFHSSGLDAKIEFSLLVLSIQCSISKPNNWTIKIKILNYYNIIVFCLRWKVMQTHRRHQQNVKKAQFNFLFFISLSSVVVVWPARVQTGHYWRFTWFTKAREKESESFVNNWDTRWVLVHIGCQKLIAIQLEKG